MGTKANTALQMQKRVREWIEFGMRNKWEPIHDLSPGAARYWEFLYIQRADADWTPGDLVNLTRLCQVMAHRDDLDAAIMREGWMIEGPSGFKGNPLAVELNRQELLILRLMGRLGLATQGGGMNRAEVLKNGNRKRTVLIDAAGEETDDADLLS